MSCSPGEISFGLLSSILNIEPLVRRIKGASFAGKRGMASARRLLVLLMCLAVVQQGSSQTNPQDASALNALKNLWKNVPPSWGKSNDPCGQPWTGVTCINGRVTQLKLSGLNLQGELASDIGNLDQLQYLDLSSNQNLGGPLPESILLLSELTTLILTECSFSGPIPQGIGHLGKLYFLALNSNNFSGNVPASLGQLTNLYWLDLSYNQFTGPLPVSSATSSGLDGLVNTKHFHFSQNQLSGTIDPKLFSAKMSLLHILFDGNKFTGPIPSTIGQVKSLQILQLNNNQLSGQVPSSISNLTNLNLLNLANNKLTGVLPDISTLKQLNIVDLSNNSFAPSTAPSWFTTLTSLSALVIDNGTLQGPVPSGIFSLPQIDQVILSNNAFNGSLNMSVNIGPQLQLVNFKNNQLSDIIVNPNYKNTLILEGNLLCLDATNKNRYCTPPTSNIIPYSTSTAQCGSPSCKNGQFPNPGNCTCAYPLGGTLQFKAPLFKDVANVALFKSLEVAIWTNLTLAPNSISLSNVHFDSYGYLEVQVDIFPGYGVFLTHDDVTTITTKLSSNQLTPPAEFGPYNFYAFPYVFEGLGSGGGKSLGAGAIAGIAVAIVVLLLALTVVTIYAVRKRKEARQEKERADPFASWGAGGTDDGSAPEVKGAKFFTYDELKKCTNGFSEINQIGEGGYGKVYRAVLPDGQIAAIKRAQQGSMQGALEFKTEIELLSRLHHKNLVRLIGFCYERSEQMLVYEYIANGTLRQNLIGRGAMLLDWKKRLRIVLGAARGLTYLHEFADPPIIHRDIKSTNILLDENMEAKVSDFGLSKLMSDSQKGHVSTQVKGTMGYLDPEYYMTQQLSEKSDVYSFGVVMLELVTGKQPIESGKYVVREVRTAIDPYDQDYYGLKDLIDPVIRHSTKTVGFRKYVQLAMECVHEAASDRPAMNEVVKEIEMILQNEGPSTASTSASTSSTDFSNTRAPYTPYEEGKNLRKSETSFDSSGGYA